MRLFLALLAFLWLPAVLASGASPAVPAPPPKAAPAAKPLPPPAPVPAVKPAPPPLPPRHPAPKPAPAAAADSGANRTLSESGQFSVLGGSSIARNEVAKRGDKHWKLFVKTTGLPVQWQHRIVVQLYERSETIAPERRAVGRVSPLEGGGYRFQMDLLQDENFRWEHYRRELTNLFLLSAIIAANPNRNIHDRVPPWLAAGVHALIGYGQNGVPAELFGALVNSRQMLSLDEVLAAVPSSVQDSVSAGVFSACSAALVQALLSQPNGKVRFQALLNDLGTTGRDQRDLLQAHFPPLRQDPAALQQWWAEQMGAMSKSSAYVVLPLAETEKRLEELLMVKPPAGPPAPGSGDDLASDPAAGNPAPPEPKKTSKPGMFSFFRRSAAPKPAAPEPFEPVHLRAHESYLKLPWAKAALAEKRKQLALLQAQAFPLYSPILAGYQQAILALEDNRTKGLEPLFDRLEAERQEVRTRMQGVEDHVNWFSTTQIEAASQEFDGYSQALELLEKLEKRSRPDPISRYLDAVEREVSRPLAK